MFNRDIGGLDQELAAKQLSDFLCASGVDPDLHYAVNSKTGDVDIQWLGPLGRKNYASWRIQMRSASICDEMVMLLQEATSNPEVTGLVGRDWNARKWLNQQDIKRENEKKEYQRALRLMCGCQEM